MIFVDSNVFVYAVGRPHPLRDPAREFFKTSGTDRIGLVTSAEVLQELMHIYIPVGRMKTLDAALELVSGVVAEVWPLTAEDVRLAREFTDAHPGLSARDLIHLACCIRHKVTQLMTFDRQLKAVFP